MFDFGAIARPLNEVLIEAEAPALIDFLSLDVEGAELEVLKGIDHQVFRFKYILVECRKLPELQAYLAPQQYRYVGNLTQHDFLFTSLPLK